MQKNVIREFDNPRDIIVVVRYLKDTYAQIDTENPSKLSKEEK